MLTDKLSQATNTAKHMPGIFKDRGQKTKKTLTVLRFYDNNELLENKKECQNMKINILKNRKN